MKHRLAHFAQVPAEHHMIHPVQAMLLGQRQQARDHAFAGLVGRFVQFGIECAHRLANLRVQAMVRMLGMVRADLALIDDRRRRAHAACPAQAATRDGHAREPGLMCGCRIAFSLEGAVVAGMRCASRRSSPGTTCLSLR